MLHPDLKISGYGPASTGSLLEQQQQITKTSECNKYNEMQQSFQPENKCKQRNRPPHMHSRDRGWRQGGEYVRKEEIKLSDSAQGLHLQDSEYFVCVCCCCRKEEG